MKSGSFAALQYRDFRLLWLGQLVSQAGTQMQRAAIAWHVYQLTDNPMALGLIGLFRVLPVVVFGLMGGLVADAQDRRKVMLITQSVMLLTAAALALMTITDHVSTPIIYAAVFVNAAAAAFDGPSRQAMITNLVPRKHVANAFSLNSIMSEVGRVVGPGIGGLLIGSAGGLGLVYAINAVSFLTTIAALLLIKTVVREKVETKAISLSGLLEGFRYLRQSPVIASAMLMDFFASFWASADALLPAVARDVLHVGAEGYGILSAAPSMGSILAGVFMSTRGQFKRPGVVMLWAVGLFGVATTLFGMTDSFWLAVICFGLTGTGDTISMILRQTIRQLATPDHLRGRLTSINIIFAMGGPQLGNFEAGLVASWLGTPFAVVSGGIGCLISVVFIAKYAKTLWHYGGEDLREATLVASHSSLVASHSPLVTSNERLTTSDERLTTSD
jgi:MFS family permease